MSAMRNSEGLGMAGANVVVRRGYMSARYRQTAGNMIGDGAAMRRSAERAAAQCQRRAQSARSAAAACAPI